MSWAQDRELNCIGNNLVADGFFSRNEQGHRFFFWLDDITVKHRGYMWIIDDPVNGSAEYLTIKEIIQFEFWRWQDESD